MVDNAHGKLYWIIVADSSKAIVYTRETRRGALQETYIFDNPLAAKKNDELISDRGGRSFDSHGYGRHTITNEKLGPRKQPAVAFAKQIVDRIVRAKRNDECREFVLIAAPRFLGYLRDALAAAPDVVATASFDKSIVGKPVDVIDALLGTN